MTPEQEQMDFLAFKCRVYEDQIAELTQRREQMRAEKVLEAQARAVSALVAELRGKVARLERANRGLVMFILRDHPDADLEAITEGGAE